jgi:cobalt/nickel transport system permease protein
MHIPNGFLDPKVSAGLSFAAAGALAYCFNKVREMATSAVAQEAFAAAGKAVSNITSGARRVLTSAGESLLLKMGAVASLIFAAQMFNFPIAAGTSGHLLGGVLAAVLLGPWAGAVVISAVLIIQSLFFADGGLLALGANIVNMAVIGTIGAYYIYYALRKVTKNESGLYIAAAVAAWASVVLASSACAIEIGLSGTFPLTDALRAMLKVHVVIGTAEALITVAALSTIGKVFMEEK